VHLAFDDQYNLTTLTDPLGRSYECAYDGRGNLVRSTDPLGHTTRFTFSGPYNRLATVTDANANLTRYAYTGQGNLESITYPDGSRESWGYDAAGNATSWINRRAGLSATRMTGPDGSPARATRMVPRPATRTTPEGTSPRPARSTRNRRY